MLQEVLDDKRSAVFNAASLCITDYLCNTLFASVKSLKEMDAPPEVQRLMAQLYIKHKTPRHAYWDMAFEIIKEAA
jgi:hypothetical protein